MAMVSRPSIAAMNDPLLHRRTWARGGFPPRAFFRAEILSRRAAGWPATAKSASRARPARPVAGRSSKGILFEKLARPERFELPTPRFVVWCSIQLSYGRLVASGRAGRVREAAETTRIGDGWQEPTVVRATSLKNVPTTAGRVLPKTLKVSIERLGGPACYGLSGRA